MFNTDSTMKSFGILTFGVVLLLHAVELEAASPAVPKACSTQRSLTLTADNTLRLYIDGVERTGLPNAELWNAPDVVDLPCNAKLIAIHGHNTVEESPASIIASTGDDYVLTNSTWKCSNVNPPGWETIGFDASSWVSAVEYGGHGEGVWGSIPGISPNAVWIWHANTVTDAFCRNELPIDYCESDPCFNGGTCVSGENDYVCHCAPGYTNNNCQSVINYCESDPCANGASCLPIVDGYVCQCPPGYTGPRCFVVINNCLSFPCLNGGSCLTGINNYVCECPPEWTGLRCDILLNPCDNRECANGGTCLNNCGVAQCICRPGWTGTFCVDYIEPCSSNPCQNGGFCRQILDNFTCTCPPSLTGQYCEQVIDLCASGPCLHGSTCAFDCGGYQCFCRDGWTGENCDQLIDACIPNPCLNGGYCNESTGASFICTCPPDYTGAICESTNFNETLGCGTELYWSQYDAANDFTRLCYFWAPASDIVGRYTECRYTIQGIPLYGDYIGLLQAGGNFGCVVSQNYPQDLPITSQIACENDYQQDVTLSNYTESARIMVCLRYPYEGQPGTK